MCRVAKVLSVVCNDVDVMSCREGQFWLSKALAHRRRLCGAQRAVMRRRRRMSLIVHIDDLSACGQLLTGALYELVLVCLLGWVDLQRAAVLVHVRRCVYA